METRFLGRQKSDILVYIFLCNSRMLDMTEALRKFYGNFNNIMSIIAKQSNDLAKTYCLYPVSHTAVKYGILIGAPCTK